MIIKKDINICKKCKWFETKTENKYRCAVPCKDGTNACTRFRNYISWMKVPVPFNRCPYSFEQEIFLLNKKD